MPKILVYQLWPNLSDVESFAGVLIEKTNEFFYFWRSGGKRKKERNKKNKILY